ncbi:adenylyltransferase/cytidyltransferase family protein [Nonomuraea sp. SYSU D8015]|uniref:adenylyltransferase/cytidyltransferase family protein n=1 Tax=Nonomuraea sp. SYSU D8015 TaxID=2593644 RepID=UPI001660E08A|nr:adenylyltransferase/cytidyltransferase family protein [Nonomuraea sp. SYSU D8015]
MSRAPEEKIVELAWLTRTARETREAGRRLALCHGCFDLVHIGHVHHLGQARQLADILVVSVSSDVTCAKGPSRPAFGLAHRMTVIAALEAVDYVCASPAATAVEVIRALRPDFYVKGPDYARCTDDRLAAESRAVQELGGRTVFTDALVTSSSTDLLGRYGA